MSLLGAAVFEASTWTSLPFHFWTVVFGVVGAMIGSFLNVCIHRMPRDESLVRPPSHCPRCGMTIRWRHNVPILSWLLLRGRCADCGARISARYAVVEALTAGIFAGLWLRHGSTGPLVAAGFCLFAAGLIVATFIDLEHLIIPDEITLGGAAAGIVLSVVAPGIHGEAYVWPSLKTAVVGAVVGAGVVFGILELGKLLLGRQRFPLPTGEPMVFTETDLHLPDRVLPYEEVFFRRSDTLVFHATHLELVDRCYRNVTVQLRLRAGLMQVGEEQIDPATVPWMQAVTDEVTVPREAMGFGDVKFMAAIGAFTGWPGIVFALMASSVVGLAVNLGLTATGRREWSARIPYGPYLAIAALVWILGGREWFMAWFLPVTGM